MMRIRKDLREGVKIEISGEEVLIGQVRVGEENWRIVRVWEVRYKEPYRT